MQNLVFIPLHCQRNPLIECNTISSFTVAVVVAFFICWAPFHAQRLLAIYGTNENHHARSQAILVLYGILTYTSGVLYYMSTCINPILYHIMCNKFRVAFKVRFSMLLKVKVGMNFTVVFANR